MQALCDDERPSVSLGGAIRRSPSGPAKISCHWRPGPAQSCVPGLWAGASLLRKPGYEERNWRTSRVVRNFHCFYKIAEGRLFPPTQLMVLFGLGRFIYLNGKNAGGGLTISK